MFAVFVCLTHSSQGLVQRDWLLFHHNSSQEQAFAAKFRALKPGEDRNEYARQNGIDHFESKLGVTVYFPTLSNEAERKRKQIVLLRELVQKPGVWVNSNSMSPQQKDFVEALVGLHSKAGHYIRARGALEINLAGFRFSYGSEVERPKDSAVDDIKNLDVYKSPLTARYSLENFQIASAITAPASRISRPRLITELFGFFDLEFKKMDESLQKELSSILGSKSGFTPDESLLMYLAGRPLSEFPTRLKNQIISNYSAASGELEAADPSKSTASLLNSPVEVEDGGFQFEVVPGYDRSIRHRLQIGSISLK